MDAAFALFDADAFGSPLSSRQRSWWWPWAAPW